MKGAVVDYIGEVVAAMRTVTDGPPYYRYGHRQVIVAETTAKNKKQVDKNKKYPLILLRLDTSESSDSGGLIHYNLNIAIVAFTDVNHTTEQRYTEVIKPILYPLYDRFIAELVKSPRFLWPGDLMNPPHDKYDRPNFGVEESEGNVSRLFTDPLDAIEIVDLKINSYTKNC